MIMTHDIVGISISCIGNPNHSAMLFIGNGYVITPNKFFAMIEFRRARYASFDDGENFKFNIELENLEHYKKTVTLYYLLT